MNRSLDCYYNDAIMIAREPKKDLQPKVANIDQIIFILSAKHPKPDLLMLDKQLAFAEFVGVNSIIVLNK